MAEAKTCRVVFMGTPEFAVPSLEQLAQWHRGQIVGVYTQPDRPSGRGHKMTLPPVKKAALSLGFPVFQPASLKNSEALEQLVALKPDIIAVAAYGVILSQAVLDTPTLDCVNVHASVLPRYRGAAPIQRAVMDSWLPGTESGVSIMRVRYKLDSGPVFALEKVPVGEHTYGSLHDVLSVRGAKLLVDVLNDILDGKAQAFEQDENDVTYAPKVSRQDGKLFWTCSAAQIHAQIRGLTPRPGANVVLLPCSDSHVPTVNVRLLPGRISASVGETQPGTVWHDSGILRIACCDYWYEIDKVRPQGRNTMNIKDFLNGIWRNLPQGFCGFAQNINDTP